MVWLGVDLGDARVGLALSDPELTLAHPIGNVQAYGDSFHAINEIIATIEREQVQRVVIGLPLLLSGQEGKSARKARRWASNLKVRLDALADDGRIALQRVPCIELIDERLTTVSAHRQLSQAQLAEKAHRPAVDQQSAVLILQTALDRTSSGERP